jgi:hypothetical protein
MEPPRKNGSVSLFMVVVAHALAGCAYEPAWVLYLQGPLSAAYIDQRSVRRNGNYIDATIRTVYTKAISDLMAEKPHWSALQRVRIDCEARSWTTMQFETFDERGAGVERKEFSGTVFYAHPDWNGPGAAPRLICEHVNSGRPLVP